ncbi:MAG: hypothetical protein M1814_001798 [Vezdaea aestivalis]|nr:MAG: hypothetical protein M1814_001798 [Vezdaea aestivalis]
MSGLESKKLSVPGSSNPFPFGNTDANTAIEYWFVEADTDGRKSNTLLPLDPWEYGSVEDLMKDLAKFGRTTSSSREVQGLCLTLQFGDRWGELVGQMYMWIGKGLRLKSFQRRMLAMIDDARARKDGGEGSDLVGDFSFILGDE